MPELRGQQPGLRRGDMQVARAAPRDWRFAALVVALVSGGCGSERASSPITPCPVCTTGETCMQICVDAGEPPPACVHEDKDAQGGFRLRDGTAVMSCAGF